MSNYQIPFSDTTKPAITLNEGVIDVSRTSLSLVGPNSPGYGPAIATNFLKLLENFASPNQPENSIEGQTWWDSGSETLMIKDAQAWYPVSGIQKGGDEPTRKKLGDIWVNTDARIMSIWNGTNWTQIGPSFSSSLRSGSYPDVITDKTGKDNEVILMYLNDAVIEIIAKTTFTPISVIPGFSTIVPGVNISSTAFNGVVPVMNGTAVSAQSLKQTSPTTEVVSANNFVRNDIDQAINGSLIINNNNGIRIGKSSSTFVLSRSTSTANIINYTDGGRFVFSIYKDAIATTTPVLILDGAGPSSRIGVNNTNPTETLDVTGSVKISNTLTVVSSTNLMGDLKVNDVFSNGTLIVTSATSINETITVGPRDTNGSTVVNRNAILPAHDDAYDIGSSGFQFRSIYASTVGDGSTIFNGSLNGTALRLKNTTNFSIGAVDGHIKSNVIPHDGYVAPGNTSTDKIFVAKLTDLAITSHPVALSYDVNKDDQVVFWSSTGTTGTNIVNLKTATKQNFLSDLYTAGVPTGSIFPFGGNVLPNSRDIDDPLRRVEWAWCDGAACNISGEDYKNLYAVIGQTYGTTNALYTFRVPNLNGSGNTGPYSLYAGTATGVTSWPIGIKYIIKL